MTTTWLPDLSHLTPAPRWLHEVPARVEPEWVQERYDELLEAAAGAGDDAAAWVELVRRADELEAVLGSHGTRIRLAYRQATDDPDATAELERWNRTISPVIQDASVELARALVASPCGAALDEAYGPQLLRLAEAACRAHAPVNTALRIELADVLMRHTRLFGQGTITWRGEEHPFSYARKAAHDPDPVERHAAWRSKIDYVRSVEQELQSIFDEAMEMRQRMAQNLGQPSYVDLRYLEMHRFDWGPDDAARVRAAIERHVVPLAAELQRRQAAALGTQLLHPADEEIQPDPAPELRVSVDEQLNTATRVFEQLGGDFAEPWRMLVDEQLIDLVARPGKGTGASCSTFPHEGVPFLFCNSVGSHDDVTTLVHEFGHALQSWRSRHIVPHDLQHPTLEACEIHSMTLELLAARHMRPFFGDDVEHYGVEHLRSTLRSVPYMAAIDQFQHEVYEQRLDAAGRGDAWRAAAGRFQPAIDWQVDGWYGRNRWLLQLHVFQYPFYYLDYALARLVSWELWLDSLEDGPAALERYLALCSAGGTSPFRELIRAAGLGDPFDESVIERTMRRLRPHLQLD